MTSGRERIGREQRAAVGLRSALVAAAVLMLSAGTAAADVRFGAITWDGDYGGILDTRIEQYPFVWQIAGRSSRLGFAASYVRIDETGNVTLTPDGPIVLGAGGPGAPPWQTAAPGSSGSGTGDLVLSNETYLVRAGKGKRPFVSLLLDVKIPTADQEEGLGTGERDYGAGFVYVQPLGKYWQLLGDAGYRWMGDPEGVDFKNRIRGSLGLALIHNRKLWRLLVENVTPVLDEVPLYNTSGVPVGLFEVEDRRALRFDLTFVSGRGGTTRLGVTSGLTDGAEDVGFVLEFATGGR
ncbi:MAG: transporter [Candidatus Polarisedimenticolia bacterium]